MSGPDSRSQSRTAPPVQRQADAALGLLRLLERPARRRLGDHHHYRSRLGCSTNQRRPHDARRRLAGIGSRQLQGRRRGQLPEHTRNGTRRSPTESVAQPDKIVSPVAESRTSSARPTGQDGRSSATPATPRTRSPPTASPTRSADAELCAAALDESFTGSRPYTEAMTAYQRTRDAAGPADIRLHDPAGDPRPTTARDATAPGRSTRQHGGDERLRQRHSRNTVTVDFFDPANIGQIMSTAGAIAGQI